MKICVSIAQRLISRKCLIFIAIVSFLSILARHKSHESEAINASSMCTIVHLCMAAIKLYLQLLRTTFQNEVGRSKYGAAGQLAKQQLRPSLMLRILLFFLK